MIGREVDGQHQALLPAVAFHHRHKPHGHRLLHFVLGERVEKRLGRLALGHLAGERLWFLERRFLLFSEGEGGNKQISARELEQRFASGPGPSSSKPY